MYYFVVLIMIETMINGANSTFSSNFTTAASVRASGKSLYEAETDNSVGTPFFKKKCFKEVSKKTEVT